MSLTNPNDVVTEERLHEFYTGIYPYLGGGGITELEDLSDVNVTTPSDGQVLKYDSTTSKWINGTGGSGGASDIDELSDVNISNPTDGQVLKYDSTSSKWINSTDNNTTYTLPTASANDLGGIKVGTGLSIDNNGVLSASGGSGADNVVEGYFNSTNNLFYEENAYTTAVTGAVNTIYVSIDSNKSYRFNGSIFVRLDAEEVPQPMSSSDLQDIKDAFIAALNGSVSV